MKKAAQLLSSKKIEAVDAAGRDILARVGIRILDNAILKRLQQSGARIDEKNQTVFMEDAWLEARLSTAPSHITLYARRSGLDLSLGSGLVYFGNGGRAFQILDGESGHMRPTVLKDIAQCASLVDQLPHLSFFIIPCQAYDIPAEHYHLNDFFQAFNATDKHIMGGCDTLQGAKQMHALATVIAGGEERLRRRPFVSAITNPISPLTIDGVALRIMDFCAQKGVPLTCAPAPMAGATAPTTLAGTLAQMHAESLAGVALCQFLHPGAPVLYGAVPSTMDLRKMNLSIGSVETAMMNTAAVALAHRNHLPIYASAGLTDAKSPDIQAGSEKMLSCLLVAQAGADFIHLAAGMLDSGNAIAYEQFILDDEMIGMVYRLLDGIEVNNDTMALGVIESVGPGGNFVLEDHTVEHMMDQHFYPRHCVRMPYDSWTREGEPTQLSRARDSVHELIAGRRAKLDSSDRSRIARRFPQIRSIEGAE
jgi:trimethylamine--corrinoid protein Co-methyltransferase